MDLVVQVNECPRAGETLAGTHFNMLPGGKGANQAVAASRSGAKTYMLGCVGNDTFGQVLINSLESSNVNTTGIHRPHDISTGIASILLEASGENRIVIVPGANGCVSRDYLTSTWQTIQHSDLVLLQHEIPLETVHACIEKCNQAGIPVLLNPAPIYPIPEHLLQAIDILVMNETEASALAGIQVDGVETAREAAGRLRSDGCRMVIITLGKAGAYLLENSGEIVQPAFDVNAVDTTAAGDTFVGAFAACQLEGRSAQESLAFASAAAAISVTRLGAQASIPERDEVLGFLHSRGCQFPSIGGK